VKIQLVEPHNHQANAAERAIQTFKNHFIAGLSTVDKAFPLQLWNDLLQQAQITLNLLRKARINNKLSTYEILEGPFNFNKTPLAPPGTKAIIYDSPDKRAYYVGPAPEHYRCYKFFVPETRAYRIAQAAVFYPQHCKLPHVDPGNTICMAAQDLIQALQNPSPKAPVDLKPHHNQALRDLSNIFQDAVKKSAPISEGEENTPPRVANQPSTSNDTKSPRVVRALPRLHQCITRNKSPLPPIKEVERGRSSTPSKTSQKHDACFMRHQARAQVREAEEAAIKKAIKENLQVIKNDKLQKILQDQQVLIEPVGTPLPHNDTSAIPVTQEECDVTIQDQDQGEGVESPGPKEKVYFLAPK
jgi:hypothetical protein